VAPLPFRPVVRVCARAAGAAGQNGKTVSACLLRRGFPETAGCAGRADRGNEAAIKSSNEAHGTTILIRQVNYVNNMAEQDQRGVKRVIQPLLGCTSFDAAPDTLVGIALMDMSKKRQRVVEAGAEGLTAAEQFYALAASSHHGPGRLPRSNLLSNMYD